MSGNESRDVYNRALVEYLSRFLAAPRRARLERTLAERTRYVTVVLEDIYQPHNANAVIRTCECLGVQDLHVVEQHNRFDLSPRVLQGAAKWVTVKRYRSTAACLQQLAGRGYVVVAMTLRPESKPLETLPVDRPLALCLGSEEPGLSETVHAAADHWVHVPMAGFTQSLNLSVSAALGLYQVLKRIKDGGQAWTLSATEHTHLLAEWMRKSISCGDALVNRFNSELATRADPGRS